MATLTTIKRNILMFGFGIIFVILVTLALYSTNWFFKFLKTIELSNIEFVGTLNFQSVDDLYGIILKSNAVNFYAFNLAGIKQDLLALPWLEEVNLYRKWPSTLKVEIIERTPFAILANEGVISTKADVFHPQELPIVAKLGLPLFLGPKQFVNEMLLQYLKVVEYVSTLGLNIKEFELMPDQGWRVLLNHNINLYLGSYDIEDRLKNFMIAYKYKLNSEIDKISYVDLRYTNGVAVGLKTAMVKP